MFRTYIATMDTSYRHILELLSYKRRELRIFEARFGIEKNEIANECWRRAWDPKSKEPENPEEESGPDVFNRRDCTFHREAYDNRQISSHLDDRKTRQTTSFLVNNYLSEFYDLCKNRVRLIKEKSEDIILRLNLERENDMSDSDENKENSKNSVLIKLIEMSDMSVPEKYIYLWKIGVKTKEQVKKELGVSSDATLYNRWDKLAKKFCNLYYSNEDIFKELK
jgi:hypothetical protein